MDNAKHKLVMLWRFSVLLLLVLNLLLACQNQSAIRSLHQASEATAESVDEREVAAQSVLTGRVVKVSDGDSITLLDMNHKQHRVRLSQIDAPEQKQPFSRVAKDALADLIATKEVRLQIEGRDRYQRLLAEVFIGDTNVNLCMVRQGYAWAYTQYVRDNQYLEAQQAAQHERLGLWRDANPLAPWEYRRQQRKWHDPLSLNFLREVSNG